MTDTDTGYSTAPAGSWGEDVNAWAWEIWQTAEGTQIGWRKRNKCPRCYHKMSIYVRIVIAVQEFDPSDKLDERCNCDQSHAKRPDDIDSGCGAHALIDRPTL